MQRLSPYLPSVLLCVLALVFLALLTPTLIAFAQGNSVITPSTLANAWPWDPLTLTAIAASWLIYDRGIRRLWAQAGRERGIRLWQTLAFKAGLVTLIIALLTPLDLMSDVLLSAHMVQHLLLLFAAAPLFTVSAAPLAFFWALSPAWRRKIAERWHRLIWLRRCWSFLMLPLTAWTVYALALWGWHWSPFYQAALKSDPIHAVEHLSFLFTSGLFWWILVRPSRHRAQSYGLGVVYVFSTALHSSILGALLIFSNQPWYPAYAASDPVWGLTPLGDQQLAGLIMWLPIGIVYLGVAAVLMVLWLGAVERDMQRRERQISPGTRVKESLL